MSFSLDRIKMQVSGFNHLPEEIVFMIFGHVSSYMFEIRGVCKDWNRIYQDFKKTKFLLLAYVYKDDNTWIKNKYHLPDNIGAMYKKPGFSVSGMEKVVDAIVEEGKPDTIKWMLENKGISCNKSTLYRKAIKRRNYKVLDWMKEQGLIDDEEFFRYLLRTVLPKADIYSCMKMYLKKVDRRLLHWYLSSGLPHDKQDLQVVFEGREEELSLV